MTAKRPQTTYTPQQVSGMLDIPTSTLRRYSRDWHEHLSASASRQGQKRSYTDTDILTLRRLRALLSQKLDHEDIAARLQVVEPDTPQESALSMVPAIAGEFENIRSFIAQMQAEHDNELSALRERVKRLEDELNTPWYKRLFRRNE